MNNKKDPAAAGSFVYPKNLFLRFHLLHELGNAFQGP